MTKDRKLLYRGAPVDGCKLVKMDKVTSPIGKYHRLYEELIKGDGSEALEFDLNKHNLGTIQTSAHKYGGRKGTHLAVRTDKDANKCWVYVRKVDK